jgi:hypothetical protein
MVSISDPRGLNGYDMSSWVRYTQPLSMPMLRLKFISFVSAFSFCDSAFTSAIAICYLTSQFKLMCHRLSGSLLSLLSRTLISRRLDDELSPRNRTSFGTAGVMGRIMVTMGN